MRLAAIVFFAFVCAVSGKALAHHVSGGASAPGSRSVSKKGQRAKPATRVFITQDFVQLDESVGQIHSLTLGGEYAFGKRFSAGLTLPFAFIDHNFRDAATGIGDASLSGKVLLWDQRRSFAFAATAVTLPTGDEGEALGRGAFGQETNAFFGARMGRWLPYAMTGVGFGYESASEPVLLVALGLQFPSFFRERVTPRIGVGSQTFLASDVLNAGSTKVFLEPELAATLDKAAHCQIGLAGRVALADTLTRKPGVTLSNTSHALLNDVTFGVSLGLEFNFK